MPNSQSDGQPVRLDVGIGRSEPSPPPAITTGLDHYAEAIRFAEEAASSLMANDLVRAQALAAIAQIHASLAAASAAVLQDRGDVGEWRRVTRQEAY